jgi:ABC-2 type transport system permease protein
MNPLKITFWFEFIRTINKRSFWIRTLAIPALLAAVIALSVFSNKASDQADQLAKQESFKIAILDQSHLITPDVIAGANITVLSGKEAGVQAVKTGQTDAFFYYPEHPSKQTVEIYAKDEGLNKNAKYESAATAILQASLVQTSGSPERAALLQKPPQTNLTAYDHGEPTKGFGRVIAPGIFLILFYATIVLLGNQMLTSTTEEKENRVIEMVLTSVSARTLIIGKILALMALGAIQIMAMVVPLLVAYFGFRSQLHIPQLDLNQISFAPAPIIVGALLFIGSFLLFTGVLVAVGSAMPTAKEASAFFGFVMLVMFIPAYALAAIISSPEQLIVQGMSFFPLTAPITLMLRNAVGNLSTMEAVIGLIILYVSGVVALALAVRIFRYGTLEYSRRIGVKELLTRKA